MARLSKSTVNEILRSVKESRTVKSCEFVLELTSSNEENPKNDNYHLRLKGKNGEIIMHQENTMLSHSRYMAARLLGPGNLNAFYREKL